MNKIEDFLTSDYIYLPYKKEYNIFYKDKDYIYKNDLIASNGEDFIYSNVSGILLGIATVNNNKYFVIENDFKDKLREKKGTKRNINKYSKEDLINLLKKYNKFKDIDTNSKVLIVSGISEYIDEITYPTLIKNYTTEILDTIDALIEILNIKKCFFSITTQECVNILFNNLGTYPKIDMKLFNSNYSIGNKYILIDKLTNYKNKNYGIIYYTISDILDIYNILRKNIVPSVNYITLSGNLLKYSKVIRIKNGTNLDDLLKYYNIKENSIFINGLLNGFKINTNNFILDKNVKSIFINTEKKYNTYDCINCGLCKKSCPVNINPKYMYFHNNKKSKEYKMKCVNCGICEYVCPSKIDLRGVYNDKK